MAVGLAAISAFFWPASPDRSPAADAVALDPGNPPGATAPAAKPAHAFADGNAAEPVESRRRRFTQWARSDAAAAMAAAQNLPEDERSTEIIAAILREWAARDPVQAFRWLATSPPGEWAAFAVALADGLQHDEPESIADLLRLIPDEAGRRLLAANLVQRWAEGRPNFAADVALKLIDDSPQLDLLGEVLSAWSRRELARAVAWVKGLPPGASQARALVHLSYGWIEADPRAAAKYASELGPDNAQFLAVVACEWAHRDHAAAAQWAQNLPEGAMQDQALRSVATAWAAHDPRGAAEFVSRFPPGPSQQEAVISIVSVLAATDPSAAVEWVADFPSTGSRRYAFETVFYQWTQSDPVSAVAWLERLPPGSERDVAIHAGAGSLVDSFPDLALQLAMEITDGALRTRQTERAARAWLVAEPEAARAWIERSNLPIDLKTQLLHRRS